MKTDTISRLITIVFDKELIPTFLQSHFFRTQKYVGSWGCQLFAIANRGMGKDATIITVPEYMAAYALHLTASSILLLVRANKEIDDDIPF